MESWQITMNYCFKPQSRFSYIKRQREQITVFLQLGTLTRVTSSLLHAEYPGRWKSIPFLTSPIETSFIFLHKWVTNTFSCLNCLIWTDWGLNEIKTTNWMRYMSVELNRIFLSNKCFSIAFASVCLHTSQIISLQFKSSTHKIVFREHPNCVIIPKPYF